MKKKLLSLMMAATMVATGTVSAFAANTATGSKTIGGDAVDSTGQRLEYQSEIKITGDVADDNNNFKPGTINVTVPTAAAFQVDKNGTFTGATLDVVNNGTDAVEVFVDKFIDTNNAVGIEVVSRDRIDTESGLTRDKISLSLKGNVSTAYLKTEASTNNSGVYSDRQLQQEVGNGHKIAEVQPSDKQTLTLEGAAGQTHTGVPSAIKDDFTLKLMVRKVQP